MKKLLRLMKWPGCCFFLLVIVTSPKAFAQQVARTIPAPYTINNMTGYYEALPADYATSGKNHPLIIFIHGVGELAGKGATTVGSKVTNNGIPRLIRDGKFPASFTSNGKSYSFIVVSPQFKEWPGSGDVFKLLVYLKTIYRIDLSRIYITGLSMGGGVTWGALSENVETAKQVAASIVVCGAWDPAGVSQLPANIALNNIPVWATHNDKDGTVPLAYSQGWVDGINKAVPANKYPARLTVWASSSHDAWTKTYDPAYKDPETGLNAYEWLLQYAKGEDVPPPDPGPEPEPEPEDPNAGKRISVKTSSTNIIYYDNAMTQLGVKAGDTLCIPPGDYEYIHFGKLTGTADKPVVIMNCGGLVRTGVNSSATAASFVFSTCKYIKVEGTGAPSIPYGFDVNGTNKNGQKMFGVYFGNGSTDFEIHHTYIHDAGMFLQAKTLQTCDHPEWQDPNFTMRNVKIHDMLCRNSAWEGFYIGNTHYLWDAGGCTGLKSHRLENVQVYNNDLENMGSDGIQISLADKGDNRVYGNRLVNYAMARNSPHAYGILSGGGSTLRIYNNFISKGYNSAIEIFGSGVNHVYNNLITDIFFEGINCSDKTLFEPGTAYIYNNTIYNTGKNGVKIYADQTTLGHKVFNNLVIAQGTAWDRPLNGFYIQGSKPILYEFSNNINYKTVEEAGFLDVNSGNFRLKAGSGAIDAGRNMSDLGLNIDFDNKARPHNGTYDVGAFEYNGSSASQFLLANAGEDQLIAPPVTSVTLNGSGSSSQGGSISGYAWKKVSGPSQGTFNNANTVAPQVTGLVAGTYVFELKVTDNAGSTATDMITVSVLSAANKAPVSAAGGDVVITLPANSTQLTGSFSLDPDGVIVSYLWEKVSGPAAGSILDVTASNTDLTGLTAGEYVYRLTVTDNGGLVTTDEVKITVQGATTNKPPVANAGADQTVRIPAGTVQLDGTASQDPDGTIASYSWKKISGPTGGNLTTATAAKTTVTDLLTAGVYVYELTVKDNEGTAATDQVRIAVNAGNKAPVANAGNNITIRLPENTAQLDGSLSADEDGTIASYSWKKISGPAGGNPGSATAAKTNVTNLSTAGEYVFELTITDNEGAAATAQVKITVLPVNKLPVARAGADIIITLPANTAQLDGSASSDEDGTIAAYKWEKVSGPAGGALATGNAVKTAVSDLSTEGEYIYRLTVTDDAGGIATDQLVIYVKLPPNKPPVARTNGDITVRLPENKATLSAATSSDEDGTITAYAWRKVAGPEVGTIVNSAAVSTEVTGLDIEGTYSYELKVTDNRGTSAVAQMKVIVLTALEPENELPVAVTQGDITIELPLNTVKLNGKNSYDTDGTLAAYEWSQVSGPNNAFIWDGTTEEARLSNLVQGEYVFRLTVTDNKQASGSATFKVVVNEEPAALPDSVGIYPNPAKDFTRLMIRREGNHKVSIHIFDLNGKLCGTETTTFTDVLQHDVRLAGLTNGYYVIHVISADNLKWTVKVLKSN